jgi:hypothetical protein
MKMQVRPSEVIVERDISRKDGTFEKIAGFSL